MKIIRNARRAQPAPAPLPAALDNAQLADIALMMSISHADDLIRELRWAAKYRPALADELALYSLRCVLLVERLTDLVTPEQTPEVITTEVIND